MGRKWWQAVTILAVASCTGCCAMADRWCSRRYDHGAPVCCYPAQPVCCYPAGSTSAAPPSGGWNTPAAAAPVCPPCR